MSWMDRLIIVVIVLATSVFPVDLQPGVQKGTLGAQSQFSAKQGQVLPIRVSVDATATGMTGRFFNRRIPFFHDSTVGPPGEFLGLVGIDMLDPPGTHELIVEVDSRKGPRRLRYTVLVVREPFPVQRLTLPKNKVDLDAKGLVRVRAEKKQVRKALRHASTTRFWTQPFIEPVEGTISHAFGRKRVINGQPRNPHSGEDIAAPMGEAVVASNEGVVRLVADHFFSGKGVFVDHGLGLHSMYFHLSDTLVKEGQKVRRGQVIGKVGATGRATGPHLHWGIRMNGARVNPYSLANLSFENTPAATRP